MTRMFVRHSVSDFGKWRYAYDGAEGLCEEMGVVDDCLFQSVDDARDVTVWHDFETPEAARAYAESDRLRAAMSDGEVIDKPEIWFTTKI